MQMAKPGYAVAYADKSKTWYEAQQDAGYQQMKYLKALMLSFPFFERVPDQQIIASDNGKQYDRLIATRGNDYLMVYNYTSRNMNIDLGKISGKQKNVWWMDASTGNPLIQPEYSNAVELSYIKNWSNHMLSVSGYLRASNDMISHVSFLAPMEIGRASCRERV